MTRWQWWAASVQGEKEGSWSVGECLSRADAIAAGREDFPGEHFWIIEARSSEARKHEGAEIVPFLKSRNKELIVNMPSAPVVPDAPPPTPRVWHGTANQAVEWVLHVNREGQEREFLDAWQQGDAQAEWPEFYDWLDKQKPPEPHDFEHITCATRYLQAERTLRIVERISLREGITVDAIDAIDNLSGEAGAYFARKAVELPLLGDDIPF